MACEFVCLWGFASYSREVPLKSLSDFSTNFICENRGMLRRLSLLLHPSSTSPYETLKKLLKIHAQIQKYS